VASAVAQRLPPVMSLKGNGSFPTGGTVAPVATGGNGSAPVDLTIPDFLKRVPAAQPCAQCGEADGQAVLTEVNGTGVLLHKECRRFFRQAS